MFKRILLALFLLAAASRAAAVDYTDIYYALGEGGYGFNVVENDSDTGSFLFVTFFIYGADNKPTWYTAQLTLDQSGNFNGLLYATVGTYFGLPWNPSDHPQAVQVGTASFKPSGPYTAKFDYVVTGPPMVPVTKSIQRQFLGNFLIVGNYVGVARTTESGCADPPGPFFDDVDITVNQPINNAGPVSIALNYINFPNKLTCTFSGNPIAWGKQYQIPGASYVCSDGFQSSAQIDELIATPHGIEGVWFAINGGCNETGRFQGLLK